MCLESSKQAYAMLGAFVDAGGQGLDLPELVDRMAVLADQRFGSTRYVKGPLPLLSVVRDSELAGEIVANGDGTSAITALGFQNFKLIEKECIEPNFPAVEHKKVSGW